MIGSRSYSRKNNNCKYVMSSITRKKATENVEDIHAITGLPDDWVPRHSGSILANYLKKREQDHEAAIQDLIKNAANINKEVDVKVRALANDLLVHIKQNQSDINDVVQQCSGARRLTKSIRNDALSQINKLCLRRLDDIADFKREALILERERVDNLRELLRAQFQRLIAIGNKTPKDLLHDFDNQIYDINQQLLSNSRTYTELEAHLRVQADESVVRARTSLNELCVRIRAPSRSRSAQLINDKCLSIRSLSADRNHEVCNLSIGKILNHVDEFDAVVSRLVQAYRNAVLKVFTGFSCKLNELEQDLGKNHELLLDSYDFVANEFTDLQSIVDRTVKRLANSIKFAQAKSLLEITGADILTMQRSLCSLGECLQVTYKILYDAGHIWDAHIIRAALAQKLTVAAVEDLLTNHDTLELAQKVPISIALEQMRNGSDADKVQHFYTNIMEMLDHTADMYMHHSQSEMNRLEEFMNLLANLTDTLHAEFEVFLQNYPRSSITVSRSRSIQTNIESPRLTNANFHLSLPRAILQTELQEISLNNWRNGFLEFFENSMSSVPEELRHQSQLWVDERARSLHMRYSVKMASHSIRSERVKAARDLRLAELFHHDSRLDSHLEAVFELVDGLPLEASQFAALDAPFLYPLTDWKNRIQANMATLYSQGDVDPEVKYLKMSSYSHRLTKHRQLYEQSLDAAITTYKRHIENRVQVGRISNVRFLSQIKMFNEGGRYSALEAMRANASLLKGSDALEACVGRALDALSRRRNQLLALADHELLPLQRVIDDVIKNSSRIHERHKAIKKK